MTIILSSSLLLSGLVFCIAFYLLSSIQCMLLSGLQPPPWLHGGWQIQVCLIKGWSGWVCLLVLDTPRLWQYCELFHPSYLGYRQLEKKPRESKTEFEKKEVVFKEYWSISECFQPHKQTHPSLLNSHILPGDFLSCACRAVLATSLYLIYSSESLGHIVGTVHTACLRPRKPMLTEVQCSKRQHLPCRSRSLWQSQPLWIPNPQQYTFRDLWSLQLSGVSWVFSLTVSALHLTKPISSDFFPPSTPMWRYLYLTRAKYLLLHLTATTVSGNLGC